MKKTQFKIKQVPQILENFSKSSQHTDEQVSNQTVETSEQEQDRKQEIQNNIQPPTQAIPEADSNSNQIEVTNATVECHAFTHIPKTVALCDLNNNVAISDQEIEQMIANQNISITEHEQAYMDSLVGALMIKQV